jgi:hypothetical protein
MRSASRRRTGLVPQPARPSRRDLPAGSSRRRNVGLGPRSSHQPAPPHPGVRRGCDGHSGPADLRARFGIEPGPLVTPPRGRVRWWATLAPQRLQTCRGREATSMRLACGHPQEACETAGARPKRLAQWAAVEVCEREIKCLITGRATIERMLRDDPEALGPRGRAAPAPADHHVAQDVELAADHLAPGYDGVEAMAGPEARPGLPIAPEPLRPPLPEAGAVALQEFVGALGSSPAGPAIYFTGIIRCS